MPYFSDSTEITLPGAEPTSSARREFHVSREIRQTLDLDDTLFSLNGNLVNLNNTAALKIVTELNNRFTLKLQASELTALGLIDEILHFMVGRYLEDTNPEIFINALRDLDDSLGKDTVDEVLNQFITQFPPHEVYRNQTDSTAYLASDTDGVPNRTLSLEELLLHWLANTNKAFKPFRLLFDDRSLKETSEYSSIIERLASFIESAAPPATPGGQNLLSLLLAPSRQHPDSLAGQLRYIQDNWGMQIGAFLTRLLRSIDFIAEEQKFRSHGPGETPVLEFGHEDGEYEAFSPDSEWMPQVVMLAKNTLVWLDQLSRKYEREIQRLDQIPDEEIDQLGQAGFTALWLIGLWERSTVSKKIKQWCGNPEAEASAYALKRYVIADSLGGAAALENLKGRCWQRGIRLASDMVPNHTGLDADWLIEHPDWYVQSDTPPFPAYKFESGNLSEDGRVEIRIEDHYYQQSDAAVVFELKEKDGRTRYIYHGNDGTTMPWNDTAQLNYLLPEVRESVIQTILQVARQTPIIRFDAAMTLAKRHFQRLWYPEPGSGGDIPSRAEKGLAREEFNKVFPQEFWREVVDRVAEEVPHTLLLAEAFWMMESYFVRTLGMHRVYNSAFMHMMKDEENAKYRQTIKNTLEFDPQILKRFVNFLNNPDEETAAVQFGVGDKYFGVTMLMLTMPGLPMIGHGQVEGLREKYGMEFSRAYWDEFPDEELVGRHERDIFPIMRKRYLFAEVENFRLFDFYSENGSVTENVYAYTNSKGGEKALVLYNNAYPSVSGWIKTSAACNMKTGSDDAVKLVQTELAQALDIPDSGDVYLIMKEHVSGLEFIHRTSDISRYGLHSDLHGYQYQVYMDMRFVADSQGHFGELYNSLNGHGVQSIDEAVRDILYRPVRSSYGALLEAVVGKASVKTIKSLAAGFSSAVMESSKTGTAGEKLAGYIGEAIETEAEWNGILEDGETGRAGEFLKVGLAADAVQLTVSHWSILRFLGKSESESDYPEFSIARINELGLGKAVTASFIENGFSPEQAENSLALIRLLCRHQEMLSNPGQTQARKLIDSLLEDDEVRSFLGVNQYEGINYFNREKFEELIWWMVLVSSVDSKFDPAISSSVTDTAELWLKAMEKSDYQLDLFLEILSQSSTS